MNTKLITKEESEKRLAELFAEGRFSHYPNNRRDRHIILKSIIMTLDASKKYTKRGITRKLNDWLKAMHQPKSLDNTVLLKHLLNEGYLNVDRDDSYFWVPETRPDKEVFEADVDQIDIYNIMREHQSKKKKTGIPQETKDRILLNAAKLFAEKGLNYTTLKDIASSSNVSVSLVRSRFKNEEILYSRLLRNSTYKWFQLLVEADNPDAPFRDRLISLITAKMELARQKKYTFSLLAKEWIEHAETGANPRLDIGLQELIKYMEDMIARAVKKGEIRKINPKLGVWHIIGFGFLYGNKHIDKFLDNKKTISKKEIGEYVDLILNGLSK